MNFPDLSMKPDGDSLQVEYDNPAADGQSTDGAYDITRPTYTKPAIRTWTFMYSDLGQADYVALENFWRTSVKGSSVVFNWTHPVTSEVIPVRFSKGFKLQLMRWGGGPDVLSRFKTNTISITEV